MITDSFVFYRSFYDAIRTLDADTRLQVIEAICEYSFNHEEIEIDPIPKAIFTLIKPQLDANYKRRCSGSKGGRSSKEAQSEHEDKADTETNENAKQTESKVQANVKQSASKHQANKKQTQANVNVNVNDNVNVNVNVKNNSKYFALLVTRTKNTELLKSLQNYVRMRRKDKLFTTEALDLNLDRLFSMSQDNEELIAIVNQSISNGWKAFYEVKNYEKPVYDDSKNPKYDEARFNELMERRNG